MAFDVPVLFIGFNKISTTQRVLNSLDKYNIRNIYFSIDGPRNSQEAATVKQVETSVRSFRHFSTDKVNIELTNLGCRAHVIKAITNFFREEEFGIILEDDTLPSRQFFSFCDVLLKRYRDNGSIWHIGGYKPPEIPTTAFAYTYTKATHVWGWATWSNRWSQYVENFTADEIKSFADYTYFDSKWKSKKRIKQLMAVHKGKIDTWDFNWNATVRVNNGLAIRPDTNLVQNIGLGDPNATNTKKSRKTYEGIIAQDIDLKDFLAPPIKLPMRKLEKIFESKI